MCPLCSDNEPENKESLRTLTDVYKLLCVKHQAFMKSWVKVPVEIDPFLN
jgi:hypothetical protein